MLAAFRIPAFGKACSLPRLNFLTMTFSEYRGYFERIIETPDAGQQPPYDNPLYIDYTRLNWARMNRWLKTAALSDELLQAVGAVSGAQEWIIITEPWCGDAAHNVPFLHLAAERNPLITIRYELRDSEPFRINGYLTNGGKSIPKLIIRNTAGQDLATWGPRPAPCQQLYDLLTAEKADFERVKTSLQNWYNADKGRHLQQEIAMLLTR